MSNKIESEYMAFRPGDLTPRIDAAARRNGCSKSEVVRKALEMYLDVEPIQPLATYLGAVTHFVGVACAAFQAGLISSDSYDNLCVALAETSLPLEKRLEPLFRKLFPGEMTPLEFIQWRTRENHTRKGGLTDEEMDGPEPIQRWNAAFDSFGRFPDLMEARRVLLRSLKTTTAVADIPSASQVSPKKSKNRKKK